MAGGVGPASLGHHGLHSLVVRVVWHHDQLFPADGARVCDLVLGHALLVSLLATLFVSFLVPFFCPGFPALVDFRHDLAFLDVTDLICDCFLELGAVGIHSLGGRDTGLLEGGFQSSLELYQGYMELPGNVEFHRFLTNHTDHQRRNGSLQKVYGMHRGILDILDTRWIAPVGG